MPKRELETKLELRCVAKVEALGGQALKLVLLGLKGWPDRTCILPGGRIFFIEVKRTSRNHGVSRQQNYWRDIVVPLGFRWYKIDNDADFDAALKEWL